MFNRFFSRRRLRGGSDTLPEGWTLRDWESELYRRAAVADTQPPMYPLSPDEEIPPTPMVMIPPIAQPLMSPQELFEELYAESPEDEPLVGLQFSEDESSESSESSSESESSESSTESESDEELFTEPESDFTTESYFSRNDTPYP